ncbi:ABC transporter permease [Nocardioides jishulii]|uniref:ABC transporter permease n=1 Tax=Nocardioides jishulii TaxID=2575440 RepID=A0A4U2YXB8_9ACTN|nr:ABC transporter permease [Nocardioides jishulii]QCX28286.1 ABC transporter permease [Nocardioides jishulii]TKI64821.1 ABC transporter permease [Nocardioides jishulii]
MTSDERPPSGSESEPVVAPDVSYGEPTGPSTAENPSGAPAELTPGRWRGVARDVTQGNGLVAVLSVLVALFIGSLLIIASDPDVHETFGYLAARPGDFFVASWESVRDAYSALFRGAVWNSRAPEFEGQIRPLTATLKFAAPLILGGLGVGLAFRTGLFNIGGRGQMLLGGAAAGWVVLAWTPPQWSLPSFLFWVPAWLDPTEWIHPGAGVLAAIVVGGLWGALAGLLKARTGAHEVIVTIMLNYVALYLVAYALSKQELLQAPGGGQPKSSPMPESALLPQMLGDKHTLHSGFVIALLAVVAVWWLLNRSAIGYRFRAVGENPSAAQTAGISVARVYVGVMFISGALLGLAGVNQVLGTTTTGVTEGLDAGIGFDAITVALLGRSSPVGILFAGLLFGGLRAGSFTMQTSEGIPTDIILVIQSLIVLFIAAPPLVRALFRLPSKEAK